MLKILQKYPKITPKNPKIPLKIHLKITPKNTPENNPKKNKITTNKPKHYKKKLQKIMKIPKINTTNIPQTFAKYTPKITPKIPTKYLQNTLEIL